MWYVMMQGKWVETGNLEHPGSCHVLGQKHVVVHDAERAHH